MDEQIGMPDRNEAPTVLVTDSGVGGLSVVRAIRAALPGVRLIYLADNAGFPYGKLAPDALIDRLVAFSTRLVPEYSCDAIVVAVKGFPEHEEVVLAELFGPLPDPGAEILPEFVLDVF